MQTNAVTWEIFRSSDLESNPAAAALLTITNSDAFYYIGRSLPYGKYAFRITVQMFSQFRDLANYTSTLAGYVNIQESIPELQLNGSDSLLWLPGIGNWTVSLVYPKDWLENVSCSWTFGESDLHIVDFIPVLSASMPYTQWHTFEMEDCGERLVTVNCSNFFSWKYYTMDLNVILDSVNVSTLVYNGPFYWNVTMSFSLNITRFGTGACFEWDMGDGTSHVIYGGAAGCTGIHNPLITYRIIPDTQQVINVTYLYADYGVYPVTVRYFNLVNEDKITLTANVWEWTCNAPSIVIDQIYLNENSPYVTTLPTGANLNATLNISCMKNQVTTTTWQLFSLPALKANWKLHVPHEQTSVRWDVCGFTGSR